VVHISNTKVQKGDVLSIVLDYLYTMSTIPVAARSKAWVCGRSLAGIVGSNPAGGMDVSLL